MAKGGSTSQQIAQLMHLLGSITFIVAIVYGLYVSTRDTETWGKGEDLAVVRVVILFLIGITFFLIALNHQKSGHQSKSKGDCDTGHHGGGGSRGYNAQGYNYGNEQNAFAAEVSGSD